MSKVCVIVVGDNIDNLLKKKVDRIISDFGLGVFFELSYPEPFLSVFGGRYSLICNISDNHKYDNCEMLLLPDDCFFNGRSNPIPFHVRMTQIECILKTILEQTDNVDLFIGNSGTIYCEYDHYDIQIQDFLTTSSILNSLEPPDLHFHVTR